MEFRYYYNFYSAYTFNKGNVESKIKVGIRNMGFQLNLNSTKKESNYIRNMENTQHYKYTNIFQNKSSFYTMYKLKYPHTPSPIYPEKEHLLRSAFNVFWITVTQHSE